MTDRLKPQHEVIRLEEEFSNGELSLAQLAAVLHEVTLALGRDERVFAEMQKNITRTCTSRATSAFTDAPPRPASAPWCRLVQDEHMRYESNPKHKEPWQRGRRGTLCPGDIDQAIARQLLEDSELEGGKRYAVHGGKAFCAQDNGQTSGTVIRSAG